MISFEGKELNIDGIICNLEFSIEYALQFQDKIFIIFDRMKKNHNLVCLNSSGMKLWEAEYPSYEAYPITNMNDCYWGFGEPNPIIDIGNSRYLLVAKTISSYECHIDVDTGKIAKEIFYK